MNPTINPLSFQSMRIGTKAEQQAFLNSLSISLKEILGVISPLNLPGSILGGQWQVVNQTFSPAPSSQTQACANACAIGINYVFNVATTLTLTNVPFCVPIVIRAVNSSAGALTMKLAATGPGGGSIGVLFYQGGTQTDFTATGWSAPAGALRIFTGCNAAGSVLLAQT